MTAAAIDPATFRALEDSAGADFVVELVDAFLEEAPRMQDALRAALAAGDTDAFRRQAHSLKSNAMTFGAEPLAAAARALETGAADVVARRDAAALDALAREYARTRAALLATRDA
jgi:HPt (histidine-containing phosphotransfer) domain-containing protein